MLFPSWYLLHEEIIRSLFKPTKWRFGHNTLGEIQYSSANLLLNVISNLFAMTEDGRRGRPLKTLEYLATSLQTFDASDPRDIVYALVSLARDTSLPNVTGNPILEVNYKKSPAEVYIDFTRFCAHSTKSLDIICRPWAKIIDNHSLPSWIRSMENAEFGGPGMGNRGRKNGQSLMGPVGEPIYSASGIAEADAEFEDGGILRAKGMLLGTITKVSLRSTSGVIFRESLELGGWKAAGKSPGSSSGVPDRIWRTLIADRDLNNHRPPLWYQRACMRGLEIADTFSNGDMNTAQLSNDLSFLREYLRRVRDVTWNRCFFNAEVKGPSEYQSSSGQQSVDITTDQGEIPVSSGIETDRVEDSTDEIHAETLAGERQMLL